MWPESIRISVQSAKGLQNTLLFGKPHVASREPLLPHLTAVPKWARTRWMQERDRIESAPAQAIRAPKTMRYPCYLFARHVRPSLAEQDAPPRHQLGDVLKRHPVVHAVHRCKRRCTRTRQRAEEFNDPPTGGCSLTFLVKLQQNAHAQRATFLVKATVRASMGRPNGSKSCWMAISRAHNKAPAWHPH